MLPIKGNEIIRIAWHSLDKNIKREHRFMIADISNISTVEENKLKRISMYIVDENYRSFIEKEYYVSWVEQTNCQMIQDLADFHAIQEKLIVRDSSTEKLSFLNTSFSSLKLIEEIEHLTTDPFVFYQKNNSFEFDSFESLLNATSMKRLSTQNITMQGENITAVKRLTNIDIIDNIEMQQKLINGYKHFNVDIYNNTYTTEEVKLSDNTYGSNRKFEWSDELTGFRYTKSSKMKEDYLLFDGMQCEMQQPSSSLFIGDAITINIPRDVSDESSWYSGKWLIYSIMHDIDENYEYFQQLTLVRYKNNFSKLFS